MKHAYLSAEEQAKQTPFDHYLTPIVERVKQERAERAANGVTQPYNRQIRDRGVIFFSFNERTRVIDVVVGYDSFT